MSSASVGTVAGKTNDEVGRSVIFISVVVVLLFGIGWSGYIPSRLITEAQATVNTEKFEQVWATVAPWAWPVGSSAVLIVALGLVAAWFSMTTIAPLLAMGAGHGGSGRSRRR